MSSYITKVQMLLSFLKCLSTTDNEKIFADSLKYETEIEKEFIDFNVVFNEESIYSSSSSLNFSHNLVFKSVYEVINSELSVKIKTFNNYFKKFNHF